MKKKSNTLKEEAMYRDPKHWKGPFYVNSKDPRVILPKINPKMGVTVNFGNAWTYVFLAAIFFLLVLLSSL